MYSCTQIYFLICSYNTIKLTFFQDYSFNQIHDKNTIHKRRMLMKRVPQAITHDINKQCDETNTYIQIKGYRLQKEDIAYLLQTQKEACGFYAMIEFSSSIIFQLAKVFRDSPYLSYDRYVPLLHDIIFVYYDIQSHTQHILNDEEICQCIYRGYIATNGVVSKCRSYVVKEIKKMEEDYANHVE